MKTIALLSLIALCGCTTRTVQYEGITYKHTSFLTSQKIGRLGISHPNGTKVEIENYDNDQVSALREAKGLLEEANKLKGGL